MDLINLSKILDAGIYEFLLGVKGTPAHTFIKRATAYFGKYIKSNGEETHIAFKSKTA